MSIRSAQLFTVLFALAALFVAMCTFSTGRLWGFPLDYASDEESILLQLLYPSFFAILGNAVLYVMAGPKQTQRKASPLLLLLITVPALIFFLGFLIVTVVFYVANQSGSVSYFRLSDYRGYLSLLLGMINITVTAVSGYIFAIGKSGRA